MGKWALDIFHKIFDRHFLFRTLYDILFSRKHYRSIRGGNIMSGNNNGFNPLLQNSDITADKAPSGLSSEEEKIIDIRPYTKRADFEDNPRYKKLELSGRQKAHISALVTNAPRIAETVSAISAAGRVSGVDFYVMTLPKGLASSLMQYKDGSGFGNVLFDSRGKFAMQVPLTQVDMSQKLASMAAVSAAFAVMAFATSQYYMTQINNKMDRISLGVDKILEFLYGDKKAELMAEVSFAKYAMNNYRAIMEQESQRIATIAGIQQARKVAMRDAEFYLSDLETTVSENNGIAAKVEKCLQIEDSLNLALQLCVMSVILEMDYSQNYDKSYLQYLEDDISLFIDKTEKTVIGLFNQLQIIVSTNNPNLWNQFDKEKLQQSIARVLDKFRNGGESELTKSLRSGLHAADDPVTYYISKDGEVYLKSS